MLTDVLVDYIADFLVGDMVHVLGAMVASHLHHLYSSTVTATSRKYRGRSM